MTQIKEGLFKSPAITHVVTSAEDNRLSKDKSPSPELLSLMGAAATGMLAFGELWDTIKVKGAEEGFDEKDLLALFAPMVKDRFTVAQMRYLMNKEKEQERARQNRQKQKEEVKALRTYTDIPPKKELEQSDHDWHYEQGEKEEERMEKIQENAEAITEEDPKDLEIQFLKEKVTQLEDALHKTEMFKPATQLQQISLTDPKGLIEKAIMNDEHYFKFLTDRADGVSSFYYDTYGIDLFRNRELAQLKNSGVKVFKRLYFEV